jgi:hypothetical protein
MASDALLTQAAPGVKTATWSSAGVTLGKTRIMNNLYMRVIYIAAANASGSNSWVITAELSLDNAGTWFTMSGSQPIVLTTVPKADEVYLELDLNMPTINPFMAFSPIVRATGILSGAGASPTINVIAVDVVPAWA